MDIDTLIYEKCQNVLQKKLTELGESGEIVSNPKLDKLVEIIKQHAINLIIEVKGLFEEFLRRENQILF